MYKLNQKSSVWLIKTIWSPQATWTQICDFFPAKIWTRQKQEVAEPFFSKFRFQSTLFKELLIKGQINFHILLQNPGSNSKILGALKTMGAIPKPIPRWQGLNNIDIFFSSKIRFFQRFFEIPRVTPGSGNLS